MLDSGVNTMEVVVILTSTPHQSPKPKTPYDAHVTALAMPRMNEMQPVDTWQ